MSIKTDTAEKRERNLKLLNSALANLRRDSYSRERLLKIQANEKAYIAKYGKEWSCVLNHAVLGAIDILLKEPNLPA